jgi:hypothetical protein
MASVAKCGHPAKHYHLALVDWRRRTFRRLEATLNWLVDFLCEEGVLIVLTNPQKAHTRANIDAALEKRRLSLRTQSSKQAAMPFRRDVAN